MIKNQNYKLKLAVAIWSLKSGEGSQLLCLKQSKNVLALTIHILKLEHPGNPIIVRENRPRLPKPFTVHP